MIKSDKKNSQVNNLINKYNKKVLINSPQNLFALLFISTFSPYMAVPNSHLVT